MSKKDVFGDEVTKADSDFSTLFENSLQSVNKKLEVGQKIRGEILSCRLDPTAKIKRVGVN